MNYHPIANYDILDNVHDPEEIDVSQNKELSELTDYEVYEPSFKYEAPSTSTFNTNTNDLEIQQQAVENPYDIPQNVDEKFLNYLLSLDDVPSTSKSSVNISVVEDQQHQAMNNECNISKATCETDRHSESQYSKVISICKSYILNAPSSKFLDHKFGTSLLSCKDGIYSLTVRKIGLGPIKNKLIDIIHHNVVGNNFLGKYGEENLSVITYYLEKVFMSLVIREVENNEIECPVQIVSGMSIEDLRNVSINNNHFFDRLSKKCLDITKNKMTSDIYDNIPRNMFTRTNVCDSTKFVFYKKIHANRLNGLMVDSMSNLKKRIIEFITNAEPKYIASSFFGNFCGLYLQRQLLEKIKNIGNKISDNVLNYNSFPGIRFSNEINLAISLYDSTGNIPTHSSSGLYNFIHQKVCEFREDICAQIRQFKFFYNHSSHTISEASENDVENFSNTFIEYFKYASICSYREKLLSVKNVKLNTSMMRSIEESNTDIPNNYMKNGVYLSAIKNHDGFRHKQLEESFSIEMKQYIKSAKIENPDFSHFYENLIHLITLTISDKLLNLELELSSYALIPGNDISSIKKLILGSSYHLNQFNKICENEIDLIMQYSSKLFYGIPMIKCFFPQKSNVPKSSVCHIVPRLIRLKHSYSPELLLDVLISAISKLPNMFQLEINNADDKFFENTLFTNFNGRLISKKSLQEFSKIERDVLHIIHENKSTISVLK
ncbi:hypothetical protein, partial [Candidatus Ichthyocystis sparus]